MLYWAVIAFLLAVDTAVLGFSGVAEDVTGVAKVLFVVFFAAFLVSLVAGLARRPRV